MTELTYRLAKTTPLTDQAVSCCLHSLPCSFKSTVLPPDQIVMFNVQQTKKGFLFYFVPGGGSTIIFFNARWVGKHFFLLWVVGLNFYSKLCMVGADFFFFIGGGA